MRKKHIIIFNPDEMRWDTMGHMGNPAAVTPFLDQAIKTGYVSFSNAFCQNPVCVPSRCSFFTGLYPHTHGHRTMSYLLHPGEDSLFSELKNAGYYVWMNARNDLFAGQIPGWCESNAAEIFYGGGADPAPGPEVPVDREGKDRYTHFHGKLGLDAQGRNYTPDDEAVDAAISAIREHAGDEQPMCIFLGLMYPHVPYQIEEPYYSAIDRSKLPPRILPEECSGKSKMMSLLRRYQNINQYSEVDWDELRAVYLAMCSKVDEQFSRLCAALKEAGIYDDCAIFFLSDHGDWGGDFGLTEKAQSCFEDCLVRVPLLIKPPREDGVDAGITDALVELVDFYATVMDYAGLEPQRTHFGRSLRPILCDRKQRGREVVFCEGGRLAGEWQSDEYHSNGPSGPNRMVEYWPKMMAQTDDDAHTKAVMARTETCKLIHRLTGEDEFYDLVNDPGERINKIDDLNYADQICRLKLSILDWLQATSDTVPRRLDARFTEEMLWAKFKKLCPPAHEAEIRGMIRSGSKMSAIQLRLDELIAETD